MPIIISCTLICLFVALSPKLCGGSGAAAGGLFSFPNLAGQGQWVRVAAVVQFALAYLCMLFVVIAMATTDWTHFSSYSYSTSYYSPYWMLITAPGLEFFYSLTDSGHTCYVKNLALLTTDQRNACNAAIAVAVFGSIAIVHVFFSCIMTAVFLFTTAGRRTLRQWLHMMIGCHGCSVVLTMLCFAIWAGGVQNSDALKSSSPALGPAFALMVVAFIFAIFAVACCVVVFRNSNTIAAAPNRAPPPNSIMSVYAAQTGAYTAPFNGSMEMHTSRAPLPPLPYEPEQPPGYLDVAVDDTPTYVNVVRGQHPIGMVGNPAYRLNEPKASQW